ncbi:MAG: TolC family outer membrane protein [Gammaproteobacteria bacterium]|nr:TolC family outer membrane protein [Gammaproteobacteria bacterium]
MRKIFLLFILLASTRIVSASTNLITVYQQALTSDPVFQQAIAQQLATNENVPISLSQILPHLGGNISPYLTRQVSSGPAALSGTDRDRGYNVNLTLTQTIFNFAQFANLAGAKATAKQAVATLNAASQDLMIRVSSAYFKVLEDVDNVRSSLSAKTAFAKQLDQVTQQYKVGLKTITDVYTAQASYQTSVADYITAQNQLANDKENLRAITGVLYPSLAKLSERFPLISPQPTDIDSWVSTAEKNNWQIKANQYAASAAKTNIKQQFAGHLPTLNVQGSYSIYFNRDLGGSASSGNSTEPFSFNPPGSSQIHDSTVSLNLAVPLVSGGQVVAQTHQAQYQYQAAMQQLEQQIRTTENITRQSYLGILAGISKINADKKAIQSAKSSLEGMEAGYRVGTEILVNVLNQQQTVFQNEVKYARDRYEYVNDLLTLKQAAGTLSPEDLIAINAWLENDAVLSNDTDTNIEPHHKLSHSTLRTAKINKNPP